MALELKNLEIFVGWVVEGVVKIEALRLTIFYDITGLISVLVSDANTELLPILTNCSEYNVVVSEYC